MLEEHGPYLPAGTDAILSSQLSLEVAQAIAAKKSGWTVLAFPQIPFGASGSNEIGGQFTFPGTYAVRPSTLRAVFMDLASELGDQGFRWIIVVHVHGAPLHLRAIDDAGDFFHDTYGGRMINLWDLVPVISGWGNAMAAAMTDAEKKEDGASLHGGMDEHSLILHLQPALVAPGYRNAPAVTGQTTQESFDVAKKAGWPGYLGSPRLDLVSSLLDRLAQRPVTPGRPRHPPGSAIPPSPSQTSCPYEGADPTHDKDVQWTPPIPRSPRQRQPRPGPPRRRRSRPSTPPGPSGSPTTRSGLARTCCSSSCRPSWPCTTPRRSASPRPPSARSCSWPGSGTRRSTRCAGSTR